MSDKIFMKEITLPIVETGENETYSFVQTDADLDTAGDAADAKAVGDEISALKQDLEGLDVYTLGLYPQMEITDTAIASFTDGADDIPVKSLTVDIEPVQSGTGDPSPENVRPISGWTGADVYVTGKNIIRMTVDGLKALNTGGTWNGNVYTYCGLTFNVQTDGSGYVTQIVINGTANTVGTQSAWADMYLGGVCVKKDISYKISTGTNGSTSTTYRLWTLSATAFPGGHRLSTDSNLGENVARDAYADEDFAVMISVYHGYTASNLVIKPMVYLGTITDTAYEPYKGNVYPITFPTEAGTVYGGTLDVTSGVLTVTNGYVDLGALDWGYNSTYQFFSAAISSQATTATVKTGICEKYKTVTFWVSSADWANADKIVTFAGDDNLVRIKDTTYTNGDDFKTANSGNHVVFVLATPVTYQLTPTEVATILGQNNIFADTGDIAELTYRADLKAYIDEKLA